MKRLHIILACAVLWPGIQHAKAQGTELFYSSHWRGTSQNGWSEDTNLPDAWSKEGQNLQWYAPYGSRSAPIVMEGRVYLINKTGSGATLQERVVALDGETGELVWEHAFNAFHTDVVENRLGWANLAGDPTTGNIYAHGVQGMFFCFDRDGKVLWSHSLTEEFGRISGYGGRTNSPIVDGDLVLISFLNSSWGPHAKPTQRILAMDKLTGEVVYWSSPAGAPLDTVYSTPVIANINGERLHIMGFADGNIYATKVATGEKVWEFHLSKRGINVSPVVSGNKVYIAHSEENLDNTVMGRVVCIDGGGKGDITKTGEIWRADGIDAGYASPTLHDNTLYVYDNSANLIALDAETGKELYRHSYGTVAKGSGVWADGKIYVGEVSGKFSIIKVDPSGAKTLDEETFFLDDGSPVEINGTPAVFGGNVFIPTNDAIYAIGLHKANFSEPFIVSAKFDSAPGPATTILAVPAEIAVQPGSQQQFKVRGIDAKGQATAELKGTWTSGPFAKFITAEGVLTIPKDAKAMAGTVACDYNGLKSEARVRVIPNLPIAEDFEKLEPKSVPPGWIASPMRCQVVDASGSRVLKKLADNPALARMLAFITPPLPAGYTVQADLKGSLAKRRYKPDMGLINCRYTMQLQGATIKPSLMLVTWDALPRLQETIEFPWNAETWYRMKFSVELAGKEALVRGKVWPRDQPEPAAWTIEMTDPCPNTEGSPALYAYSNAVTDKSAGTEACFDNIIITRNE